MCYLQIDKYKIMNIKLPKNQSVKKRQKVEWFHLHNKCCTHKHYDPNAIFNNFVYHMS